MGPQDVAIALVAATFPKGLVKNKVLFLTETPNDCKKTLFYASSDSATRK